jgi:Neocarzinostatin family
VSYRLAPLVFDRGLPPAPTPTLTFVGGAPGAGAEGGRPETFEDGEVVQVAGRGFPASLHSIQVTQCIARPGASYDGNGPCDTARTASVPVGADGTFTAEIRVFREIAPLDTATGSGRLRWTACDPCALVVGIDRLPGAATLPVEVEVAATGDPVRPTLRLVPGGPHQPGQRVRVEGEGFQIGQEVGVASCIAGSWQACGYREEGFPHADAEGRVAIDGYPLPDTAPCPSRPGACVLAWLPSIEGAAPGLTIPLDLSAGDP